MPDWRFKGMLKRQGMGPSRGEPRGSAPAASVRTASPGATENLAHKEGCLSGVGSDVEPLRTDSHQITLACPAWHSATEHTVALLAWMQGPGGRAGEVPARELMRAHAEMCAEKFWEPMPWIPVAKAFRKLINDTARRYASQNSHRFVVYRVPDVTARSDSAAGTVSRRRKRACWRPYPRSTRTRTRARHGVLGMTRKYMAQCSARTRTSRPCVRKALANGRCRNHGGLSIGTKKPDRTAAHRRGPETSAGRAGEQPEAPLHPSLTAVKAE